MVGAAPPNPNLANGRFYLVLKDRGDRDVSSEELIERLRPKLNQMPGINLVLRTQQDINLAGRGSRSQYQYVLSGGDSDELGEWASRLAEHAAEHAEFSRCLERNAAARRCHQAHHRSRRSRPLRPARGGYRSGALRRVRPAADQRISERDQPVQDHSGGGCTPAQPRRHAAVFLSALAADRADGAAGGGDAGRAASRRSAQHQSRRHVSFGDDLFQHGAGCGAGRRGEDDRAGCDGRRRARDHQRNVQRHGAGVPGIAVDAAVADARGARDGLHHSRRAVRELRASADDSVDAAVGRRRRHLRAVGASDRIFRSWR